MKCLLMSVKLVLWHGFAWAWREPLQSCLNRCFIVLHLSDLSNRNFEGMVACFSRSVF